MRSSSKRRAAVLVLAAISALGHVAASAADARTTSKKAAAAREDSRKASAATAKRKPPRFEAVDDTSFTITEQTRVSGDARAEYDSALQLLAQGRYEQGIARLNAVVEKAPDVAAPYINLGIAYERTGDLAHAEESLKKAAALSPSHPVVYDELGLVYRQAGRFAEARASYEKSLEIHSGFHLAHRNLGILCDIYLNDLPCALTHYEAYGRAEPEDKEVVKWIADIRSRLGR